MRNIKPGTIVYDNVDKCEVKIIGQVFIPGTGFRVYRVRKCGAGGCKTYERADQDLIVKDNG